MPGLKWLQLGLVLRACIAKSPLQAEAGARKLLGVLGRGPELSAGGTAREGHGCCHSPSRPLPGSTGSTPAPALHPRRAFQPLSNSKGPNKYHLGRVPPPCPPCQREAGPDARPQLSSLFQPSHFALLLGDAHPDTWGIALPSHCLPSSHSSGMAHTPPRPAGSARHIRAFLVN